MSAEVCPRRLSGTLDLLERIAPENRLSQFASLCRDNGLWSIPEPAPAGTKGYTPVLFEVSLFGVFAAARDVAELVPNWIRAARNTLRAFSEAPAPRLAPAPGDPVLFCRTPGAPLERGVIRALHAHRPEAEVCDAGGKPLYVRFDLIHPDPDMPTATHGRHPAPPGDAPAPGGAQVDEIEDDGFVTLWPPLGVSA
ncbi:hypothetical protein PVW47_01545 [Marinovum sp. SP66]|uniref:hypothetical protein n=1 Tax=Marinovum TaxID=367771 RepID=UPI00237A13D2|nr:hypothetical protein [Marinovum sp. SP66]MDD9738457.1 hypothetical protein [Marinovum sp. SP66]